MNRKRFQKLLNIFFFAIFCITIISCKKSEEKKEVLTVIDKSFEESLYRPNYHFTPKANWMNDPNGMFYLNGKYHLYFQYYPDGNVWGPMHWGHAISKDLIEWEEQPIALYPDEMGLIFSGSAVVDKNNTSGFGKDGQTPIVAMYTYHNMEGEKSGKIDFQTQAIAYSLDEGSTWVKYDKNPVISNPGIKDFRDPKVIWEPQSKKWIMVLAAANKIMLYSSKNLKEWKLESDFGQNFGQHNGMWECPDLFPIQIEGTDITKWVLLVSINPAAPNGGSGTQYFVGNFDGKQFTLDKDFETQLNVEKSVWIDYGRDNYAGVTWSNIPKNDGRKLFIGWMSNWEYARDVPTETWRSTMTIARDLKLKKDKTKYVLTSEPVHELSKHVSKTINKNLFEASKENNILSNKEVDLTSLKLEFEIKDLKEVEYTFVFKNSFGDSLSFGLDNIKKEFFLNRKKSGKVLFSEKFANTISKAKFNSSSSSLKVEVLLDKTSIEIFYNNGQTVMTELFFPNQPLETLFAISSDNQLVLENLKIQELKFK